MARLLPAPPFPIKTSIISQTHQSTTHPIAEYPILPAQAQNGTNRKKNTRKTFLYQGVNQYIVCVYRYTVCID
jgi:hypothetical protein